VRAVLDTSVLIGDETVRAGIETSISAISISELHFGLLVAGGDESRALRAARLGMIEARFPNPLPLDDRVARALGRLKATVAQRGGRPRRRVADLAIAATAMVHEAVLITADVEDLKLVDDLVDVRHA
jgi:predicted nucleic acid-binding protein